jgi:general stress protein YciG
MKKKSKKGFASMDPEKQREIARKGGKAAQRKGKAHKWTREEAVEAGRKGGKVAQARGTGNRFDSVTAKAAVAVRRKRNGI